MGEVRNLQRDESPFSWTYFGLNRLTNAAVPLLIHHTQERCYLEDSSLTNPREVEIIVERIKQLMEQFGSTLLPEEIGVMAPFRNQVRNLRLKLRHHGLGGVNVGTVEDYQGQEFAVTFVSVTRSDMEYLIDHKRNKGKQ